LVSLQATNIADNIGVAVTESLDIGVGMKNYIMCCATNNFVLHTQLIAVSIGTRTTTSIELTNNVTLLADAELLSQSINVYIYFVYIENFLNHLTFFCFCVADQMRIVVVE
jgi:hypothetical protein